MEKDIMSGSSLTVYYNGWTREKLWDYVYAHMAGGRLDYNEDNGYRQTMGNGDTYEVKYTNYTPGTYGWTEKIYINGVLVQVTDYR